MVYDVDDGPNTLTCALPGKDETKEGNNVEFQVDENTLTIFGTKFDYCDPSLSACDCNNLLGQVLSPMNTQDVNRIVGRRPSVIAPNVQPDEAGCRCYLATASDAGFRFVKMEQTPDKQKCNEIKTIFEGNSPMYIGVCAQYAKDKCFNEGLLSVWQIAKNREDIKDPRDHN